MGTGLPNAKINVLNGQLGRESGSPEQYLLVLSGVAVSGKINLNEPKKIIRLAEAEELGLDATYDTDNSLKVYQDIADFYSVAPLGTVLWVMLIGQDTTMAAALDKENEIIQKALIDLDGKVTFVAINRVPDGDYAPTVTEGIDPDVVAAVQKGHELALTHQQYKTPFRLMVGGRDYTGTASELHDFEEDDTNTVGVVLASTDTDGHPAVGLALGWAAAGGIQEAISKVERGALPLETGYYTDGTKVQVNRAEEGQLTDADVIYNKRYIAFRQYANRNGIYFSGFLAACSKADDYSELQRGRVIDRALRVAYDTMIEQIDNDLEINEAGYPAPSVMRYIKGTVETALSEALITTGAASGIIVEMEMNQNLLSTDTIVLERVAVRPKGYPKYLEANIGFDNPLNS